MLRETDSTYPTVLSLVAAQAARRPDAPAIESLAGVPLSYRDLLAQMLRTRRELRCFGIGPSDPVAMMLPDGPDAAVAFLAVAAAAVAAPLNPAFRLTRLPLLLQDLSARALLVPAGSGGEAVQIARRLGIQVIELLSGVEGPGRFDLRVEHPTMLPVGDAVPDADATALLYISGSTAHPTLVPLTHRTLSASAQFSSTALELTAEDRALHVVPMCSVQGLVTSLLAPLAAGGTVICTPGFQEPDFLTWLRSAGATWYTAVPAMHQAIVERARQFGTNRIMSRLRFVQSSASEMSPQLFAELEEVFGVPVVDGHGMAETAPISRATLWRGARASELQSA